MAERSAALDLTVSVLHAMGRKARSKEIAEYAVSSAFQLISSHGKFSEFGGLHPSELARLITLAVQKHCSTTAPKRTVVTGTKTGGWELGPAASKLLPQVIDHLRLPPDTGFTGLVGEFAVMSELAGCGWNAAKLAHDDGVDILAVKGHDLRTLQVKTAHESGGCYRFTLRSAAHRLHANLRHYYVLVLRTVDGHRFTNDYLILDSPTMRRLEVALGLDFHRQQDVGLVVRSRSGQIFVGDEPVDDCRNTFWQHFS